MPRAKPLKAAVCEGPPAGPAAPSGPPRLFAGTSGWAYPTWKPGFYPAKLAAKGFLGFYASQVNSVEVNYTFRTLPSEAMLQGWLAQTAPGFRFSFKAPQRITHFNRLRDCEEPVRNLLAALNPAALAGKLGLILFQLPPNFKADPERLRAFLAMPPLRNPARPPLAFEFRHESWFCDEVYAALREADAALCIAETDDLDTPRGPHRQDAHLLPAAAAWRLRGDGAGGFRGAVHAACPRARCLCLFPARGRTHRCAERNAVPCAGGLWGVCWMNPGFDPPPFVPRRFLANGHLQTILGNVLPRPNHLPEPTAELVEVSPATEHQISSQVLCHCHWQPEEVRSRRMTVLVLHGLEGSSSSQYVLGNAGKMWRAGMNVVRMNMRNCGGTEALTPTLYHSGLSSDVEAVMRSVIARYGLERVALVGYSMGGNLVLKLAGDLNGEAPRQLRAVVGVSPALDLGPSSDALHNPVNRIYERRFLSALLKRFRRKVSLFPRVYDARRADGVRSVRDFDERITSFYSGFRGAEDYYHRAAAARVLERIAVPTLILHALDDPFVRLTAESRAKITANPQIKLIEPEHGGHCAFLASANPASGDDGYWAESTLLQFLRRFE